MHVRGGYDRAVGAGAGKARRRSYDNTLAAHTYHRVLPSGASASVVMTLLCPVKTRVHSPSAPRCPSRVFQTRIVWSLEPEYRLAPSGEI